MRLCPTCGHSLVTKPPHIIETTGKAMGSPDDPGLEGAGFVTDDQILQRALTDAGYMPTSEYVERNKGPKE